jgi:two-component system chemotaxis response regulator CheB
MTNPRVVVIGASAGGVEALKSVLCGLPADFPAAVFVVLHIPPFTDSALARILSRCGSLPARQPANGDPIEVGTIFVASPDHHLLVEKNRIGVAMGPKENRFRPSIDALFRSAAHACGPLAIGVVLSGALDDGTAGLWSIKRYGGIAVVQEPSDASFDSMPESALRYVKADHQLPATEIGALLARLVASPPPQAVDVDPGLRARTAKEIEIAAENGAFQKGVMDLGDLTPFTCPECHGVLVKFQEGQMSRFRYHTGHAYTDSALLEGVMETTGAMLWQVMRSLEEAVMVLSEMAENLHAAGSHARAKVFLAKARELEARSSTFHDEVLRHESLSGDNLGQDDPSAEGAGPR